MIIILISSTLLGCAGIKIYPNSLDKNFTAHVTKDSGSGFSDLTTSINIYEVNRKCEANLLGTVQLENGVTEIGLPLDQLVFLYFNFSQASFLNVNNRAISLSTFLYPQKRYRYEARMLYIDDIYNVEVDEINSQNLARKEINTAPWSECNESWWN